MRSLSEARTLWVAFKRRSTLDELRADVRIAENGDPTGVRLRSAYWKALLLFNNLDLASWQATLASSRSAYEALRARFLEDHGDEALVEEIQQDVERCMPGIPFFQDVDTQRILTNVLRIFCKLNPDLGYRQGMHELLAPIVWVIDHDAIDLAKNNKAMGDDHVLYMLFSLEHIEHDAFALFGQVMQNAKKFYEQTTHASNENPIVSRSQRIATTLLSQIDPELAGHLDRIDIVPQIFLIRWIRLLFGREFDFADVLTVWDVIFAEDPTLDLVDHISLAMLLRIRWELLDSTYNEALTTLLHYPGLDHEITAQSMVIDAWTLRSNMAVSTANRLVVKYTGRAMLAFNKPATPPALQRNMTSLSGMDAFRRSFRSKSGDAAPQINFEALLQSTAQNIMSRGEQLGIGKAVRSAIDEVHRKAQDIRESSGSSSPGTWRQRPRSSHTLAAKLKALEQRNAHLAQLLDGAVTQLWDLQKLVAENREDEKQAEHQNKLDLETLSVAIGQVQYVQVYLQDSSLPLTIEASSEHSQPVGDDAQELFSQPPNSTEAHSEVYTSQDTPEVEQESVLSEEISVEQAAVPDVRRPAEGVSVSGLMDPSAFDDVPEIGTQDNDTAAVTTLQPSTPVRSEKQLAQARPPLSETKFSWMLGQSRGATFSSPEKSTRDATPSAFDRGEISVVHKSRKGIRPKKKYATQVVSTDVNLNFDA